MAGINVPITHTEGESNTSQARRAWAARHPDAATRDLLARDADAFLHQSLSSPCVSTIARAEGIWIEDTAGRRYMDFHGNSAKQPRALIMHFPFAVAGAASRVL